MNDACRIIVVIGVSGSGKTTIGRLLAHDLGWRFFEGDDFHSAANVEKMRTGVPLDDEDRWPWLHAIRDCIDHVLREGGNAVFACSALKHEYRQVLTGEGVCFVYLRGDQELFRERLEHRRGHFFDPGLLADQFATLEEPDGPGEALLVDADASPDEIVAAIARQLDPAGTHSSIGLRPNSDADRKP